MNSEFLGNLPTVIGFSVLLGLFFFGLVIINKKTKKSEELLKSSLKADHEALRSTADVVPEVAPKQVAKPIIEKKPEEVSQPLNGIKPEETAIPKTEPKPLEIAKSAAAAIPLEIAKPAADTKGLEVDKPTSIFDALSATRKNIWGRISTIFGAAQISNLDDLEEILYTSDLGPQTVQRLLAKVNENLSRSEKKDSEIVRAALKEEMLSIFSQVLGENCKESIDQNLAGESAKANSETKEVLELFEKFNFKNPSVWLIVGVNGAGKTTTIGKIAAQLARSGKKVLVAAGDTFRAAAGSQLQVWTERAQVEIFSPVGITDPSAVAFDAVNSGKAKGYDVIIVDTAGRLHTQVNLMEEIKKMKRVVQKVVPDGPHEILLILDANQGQNALMQAKEFHKALEVTGVILTKMDGTAKGGVAVGVTHELQLPIKLIGVGEKISDLQKFSAKTFVDSIL
jgi:fused signal recognition particle receptor